jgi:hypothetical protein
MDPREMFNLMTGGQDRMKAPEQDRRKPLEPKMKALFRLLQKLDFYIDRVRFYLDDLRVSDSFLEKSIKLLEDILPQEFHEEWLGDLRERYYQLIDEHTPPRKVYFITLLTGLGLILSYLWLKADKFVSRWITRAK